MIIKLTKPKKKICLIPVTQRSLEPTLKEADPIFFSNLAGLTAIKARNTH